MKRLFLLLILSIACVSMMAQENNDLNFKRWEHNIYVGIGRPFFSEQNFNFDDIPLTGKIGYGLNYYLTSRHSLQTGVSYYFSAEHVFDSSDGGNDEFYEFLDIPLLYQYHVQDNKNIISFGIGPVLSFVMNDQDLYIDAIPITIKDVSRRFNLLVQPSVRFKHKHFIIGLEGNIGLLNMNKPKEGWTIQDKYIHSIILTSGVSF